MPRIREKITHAAVLTENGDFIFGKCHADCFYRGFSMGFTMSNKAQDQGFMTNKKRFVDRKLGAKIAYRAGQIDKRHTALISEMIWMDNKKYKYDHIKGYVEREGEDHANN